ncbi:DUF4126 family protein [Edaphobacter sp. 12200R-103]|uniref:DUF4126 family protein n=1 Tax=Edaphobacter sp. 12200R-103 TaxID=2703788 RepID=UPI00138BA796|nr:DUF4126 family protein [Edaphobacter sp. 12200R-103]QHS52730.1 DUF4126 family protein [Edaphobacter sp. 12200R-103]
MTLEVLTWLIAIPMLGFITGMRTLTPITVLSWFAWLHLLPLDPWATWAGKLPVVLGFTLLAAMEYAADKYGRSPRPTRPAVLLVRVFLGGLVGAIIATSLDAPTSEGIILGVLGALVGAFVAYQLRHQLTSRLGCKVWHITLAEDIFAIFFAIFCMGIVTG